MKDLEKVSGSNSGAIANWIEGRRDAGRKFKSLIKADKAVDPDAYYFGPVDQLLYAFPVVAPIPILIGYAPEFVAFSAIPMTISAAMAFYRSRFIYLGRLKRGVAALEPAAGLGEIQAESPRGTTDH